MGKIELTIHFLNGVIERFIVDPVFGWDYSGDFIIINEVKDGETESTPFSLRDIAKFTRHNIETVH